MIFWKLHLNELYKRLLTGFALGLLVIITLLFCPPWVFAAVASFFLALILITEWPQLVGYNSRAFWLLTPLYPILPFILIIGMQLSGYELVNILLFIMIALFDTGSYLVGKLWGTHKISPIISPGKTWEGFAGGIVFAFSVASLFFIHTSVQTIFLGILPFTIVLCSTALCGDLFESFLKRRAGIKDSGSFLPGHGGILDRIDGILFAGVIAFILRDYLKYTLTYL